MMNELSQTLIFKPSKQAKHATFPQIRKKYYHFEGRSMLKEVKIFKFDPHFVIVERHP